MHIGTVVPAILSFQSDLNIQNSRCETRLHNVYGWPDPVTSIIDAGIDL